MDVGKICQSAVQIRLGVVCFGLVCLIRLELVGLIMLDGVRFLESRVDRQLRKSYIRSLR